MSASDWAGLPKYRQVAAVLRDRIEAGQLPPGAVVPPESKLRMEFGYDRKTIRAAIAVLQNEGLVDVVHGRGSFVRSRRLVQRDIAAGLRYEHAAAMAGESPEPGLFASMTGTKGVVEVEAVYSVVQADEETADAFETSPGEPLLQRRYVFRVDGSPHQVTNSYLMLRLVGGTPLADPGNERPGVGTMAQLVSLGVSVDHVDSYVRARNATAEEARGLAIPEGMPIFAMRRVMWAAGKPVEVGASTVPADTLELRISVDL